MSSPRLLLTSEEIVEILLEAAKRAMTETAAKHPCDLAAAGSLAIESAGETVDIIQKRAES